MRTLLDALMLAHVRAEVRRWLAALYQPAPEPRGFTHEEADVLFWHRTHGGG